MVFATTSYFLERMGLRSLDELPPLAPHLPEVEDLEAELGQLAEARPPASRRPIRVRAQPNPSPDPSCRSVKKPESRAVGETGLA